MQAFKALLHTAQNRPANVQGPIVHDANRLERTSRPFCTRRKTVMQTFKNQLFTMQNRPANVQCLFVLDAKPSCKRSMSFCTRCKTVMQTFNAFLYTAQNPMQMFKNLLYTTQNRHANVQGPFVPCVKPLCKCSGPHCS